METDRSVFDPKRPFPVYLFRWVRLFILFTALFTLWGTVSEARGQGGETSLQDNDGDASHSRAWTGEPEDLDGAVGDLARELVQGSNLKAGPVLISAHDLYDANSGLSLPLATQLRAKLITEMKKNGCRVLLPGADTRRCHDPAGDLAEAGGRCTDRSESNESGDKRSRGGGIGFDETPLEQDRSG